MSYDIEITVHHADGYMTTVFDSNITYNVRPMLIAAGLQDSLWTLNGLKCASIADLMAMVYHTARKDKGGAISALQPDNSWGTYEHLMPWLKKLYIAVRTHPRGIVSVF